MERRQIGDTDLYVSTLCFGTMLFGESTDEATATRLLNVAADSGVNFWDSAEMYPVPQSAATQGRSEAIFGGWMRGQRRQDHIVCTKVAGPGGMDWLRGGPTAIDGKNITEAIEGSLRRLQTDYIDLVLLHWPDRYVPMFGDVDYDPVMAYAAASFEEQVSALAAAAAAGKLRHWGLSNETPWGLVQFCAATDSAGFSRPVALQNAYSLTCRTFDSSGLAEACHQERVSLLAYSPLAMGLLTGKYLAADGGSPTARLNLYRGRYAEAESRYGPKPNVREAVAAYVDLAKQWGITGTEMAIRFAIDHPLVASAVTGATSEAQLRELIAAAETGPLDEGLREEIDATHARYPNPTP